MGEYPIREHLRYLNREVRTRKHLSSDEAYLDVQVPIASLEAAEVDPEAVSLQLLDTPGPNEAGEESLKFQVHNGHIACSFSSKLCIYHSHLQAFWGVKCASGKMHMFCLASCR